MKRGLPLSKSICEFFFLRLDCLVFDVMPTIVGSFFKSRVTTAFCLKKKQLWVASSEMNNFLEKINNKFLKM